MLQPGAGDTRCGLGEVVLGDAARPPRRCTPPWLLKGLLYGLRMAMAATRCWGLRALGSAHGSVQGSACACAGVPLLFLLLLLLLAVPVRQWQGE